MARATNPGAPKRVSAHVVPKAQSFSADDEDEKTTIESGGWEEEASTTVEQGEVADKLRALAIGAPPAARSNTAITSTDGSLVTDEPTVDDQRASAALARLPPTLARLVITQGSDAGRSLEVRPGKIYTVGRGIDNDLVLTDITASRKHFDVRNDGGSWILADRGSGNGTAINNRIEDAPFMLASGDRIEVGNTAFRFDLVTTAISLPGLPRELPAPGASRDAALARAGRDALAGDDAEDSRELPTPEVAVAPPMAREPALLSREPGPAGRDGSDVANGVPHEVPGNLATFDGPVDDGSVDDDLELSTVSGKPLPSSDAAPPRVTASRPKTLPPPAPLPRPRTQTGRPPMSFTGPRSQQLAIPQQQPAIPPSALAAAMAPTMHAVPALAQPGTTLPLPQMANRPPLAPGLLEQQLAPLPATLPGQGPPLPVIRGPRLPFSYPGAQELVPQRVSGSMRIPVHVAPGHPGRDATSTAQVHPMSYSGSQAAIAPPPAVHRMVPPLSRRTKLGLGMVGIAVFAAIATIAIVRSASDDVAAVDPRASAAAPAPAPAPAVAPKAGPPVVTPIAPAPVAATTAAKPPAPDVAAKPAAAGPSSGATAPSSGTNAATGPSSGATAPSSGTSAVPGSATTAARSAVPDPAQPAPPSRPVVTALSPPPSAAPPPVAVRTSAPEVTAPDRAPSRTAKPAKRVEPRKPEHKAPEPVVAAAARPVKHSGRSMQDVKGEATGLYRSKNFSGAALAISSSLTGFGAEDVKELKNLAGIYSQLGKAYAVGMAPGTRATEAYQALVRAIPYDKELGSAYASELRDKLASVAPRAATSYMAAKNYEQALLAVRTGESVGSTSDNNKIVRASLDDHARELISDARAELSTNPDDAKQKLRQVLVIVEQRSQLFGQAQKLLGPP